MCSLLSQLIHYLGGCSIDPEALPNKMLEKKRKDILSLSDLGKLCDMVARTVVCFPLEPIIVIDALDEYTDINALLGVLVELNWLHDVRLLVTS